MGKVARTKGNPFALLEVGLFYALAHFVIWGSTIWRPPVLLVAVVMVGICVYSNRIHKDSWERIGLAKKNFWPNARLVSKIALPFVIPLLFLAWGKEARGDGIFGLASWVIPFGDLPKNTPC